MKQLQEIKTLVFGLVMLLGAEASAARDVTFEINVTERLQRLEGWGVSLCWWAGQCGRWDEAKLDTLLHWIVDKDGLNYNVFRYNIPGGDDPENRHCDPHHMGQGKGLRAEMEGFKTSAKGKYQWEADAPQRRVLLKLRELRPNDLLVEAFSNTPPYYMTVSGCAAGHDDAGKDNLREDCRKEFCRYLVDVCKHYKRQYGMEFHSLEPFNEPQTSYWNRNGSQEGCHFDVTTMTDVSRILSRMMKKARLKTRLAVTDETSVRQSVKAFDAFDAFQTRRDVMARVGQWNTHTYEADSLSRVELRERTKRAGVPLWMSETGAGGNGLEGNLRLSQRLMDDPHSIAAVSPDGKEIVLVSQNNSNKKTNYCVSFPIPKTSVLKGIERYITDERHNCTKLTPSGHVRDGMLTYTLPKQSISTFVITTE